MTPMMRRPRRRVMCGLVLGASLAGVHIHASTMAPAGAGASIELQRKTTAAATAVDDFQKRLAAYLKLREALAKKLEPLRPTADAAELATRQEALASALKTARKDARPGDLIPPAVADTIRATVTADLASRTGTSRHAATSEIPTGVAMAINRTYPKDEALPTLPPLLLGKLPPLPDNLQYRFANRNLVLLDGDTQLIVDYVANVLPPK